MLNALSFLALSPYALAWGFLLLESIIMNEEIKNAHWTRLLEFLRTIGWNEEGAKNEVRRCKALYAEGPRDRGDGVEVNINWELVLERTAQSEVN